MAFSECVTGYKSRVEKVMNEFMLSSVSADSRLGEAIQYAVATEGKRIRPLLSYATAELLSMAPDIADYPAASIELVHTYSLVHDDLPAMDDDDLRRGRPTVHKAFDEATAVLVGDAMLTHGFDLLASAPVEGRIVAAWVRQLAATAGAPGMIQGQSTDLEGEVRALSLTELEAMLRKKTGALIEASMTMIARAAGDESLERQLKGFAHHLGLAFQVRDDILDVEAPTEILGKPSGSDIAQNKSTFVSLMGIEPARQHMMAEYEAATAILDQLGPGADGLRWVADYIVAREF